MEKYHIAEHEKLSESEYCEAISEQQLQKLLNKNETKQQLKDAITIYFKAQNICKELYSILNVGECKYE